MMGNFEVPVYLFTGFLGSGKTTFLMDLLSGEDCYDGERTMVLLCEEGEVELDPEQFAFPDVFVERIQKEDLQPAKLADLTEKHMADRILIEYNGMWPMADLFTAAP